MKTLLLAAGLTCAVASWSVLASWAADQASAKVSEPSATTQPASALHFSVKDIDGKPVSLSQYAGNVVLIVNVASKCGNTPQYKGLEELYQKYRDRGLIILGFPANNFGGQEPGSNAQIKTFCTDNYHVTFPMFSKISVLGSDQAPLYRFLTEPATNSKRSGDIQWNFEKFLIARDGTISDRFSPKVEPESEQVVKAIEAELAKPKP